jgi:cleavage and polyadenylation specificity factor subunit 3
MPVLRARLSLQVHHTVTSGGKVLVPVFAVGRAQELLILLDEHWTRTQQQVGVHGYTSPQP